MAIDAFESAMPLINARFQEYGRAATPEDIAGLRSQAESLGLDFSDPNLGFTPQYQSWATAVANAAKPAPVASPLSYLQVGQQLFNRGLAQPEINYLQSLYGQDVDPTEMSALQKALAPNEAIGGLYQSVLGRAPDPFGQMYWSQIFGSEISPEEEAAFRQAAAPEIAARPTGGLSSITSSVGALPTSSFDAFGNPRSGTWTEDRYNPNDPASSSYIADPNSGQYVFDPVTGKHTLVSGAGATSVTSAAGNDSVSAAASSSALDTSSRFYQQAGPQPLQGFNTTPDNRIYNGVVYNTVAEADAQRFRDQQKAGQASASPEVGTLWDLNANYKPGSILPNPLIGVTNYGKKLITVGDPESGGVSEWVNKNVVDYFM